MRRRSPTAGLDFERGAVGAGTGHELLRLEGRHRHGEPPRRRHTVGVLLLTNFGVPSSSASTACPPGLVPPATGEKAAGSCIGVVATDAPLSPQDLERLARRVGLGLARAGSVAHNGSGEIFIAFATADERTLRGRALDGLFQATVDASEEAVLDSLWAAVDTSGRDGRTVYAFPRGM